MTAALFLAAGFLLLLVAVHPFVTYPMSLALLGRWRAVPLQLQPQATSPRFSVLLCAYNEEAELGHTLDNLLALRATRPDMEILVYVDAAGDGTADIARRYVPAIDLIVGAERNGKTYGMNLLAARARGDVLILTDATVRVASDALERLSHYFSDPAVGCVCGHLVYEGQNTATAQTGSLYWRLEERIKQMESRIGSVMGADGSIYAVRRAAHRPVPAGLIDDMYLSLDTLCRGWRIVSAPDVRAVEAAIPDGRDEFRRKIRMSCQGFGAHRVLWPRLRQLGSLTRYMYVSHKLLRWFTIFTLATSAMSLWAGLLLLLGPLATLSMTGGGLAILLAGWRLRPVAMLREIILSFTATGLGVIRALRGVTIRTWEPAASIRRGQGAP